jgi:predicted nucleic acid-binding Zn ribbon protein
MSEPRHCLVCNNPITPQEQEGVITLAATPDKTLTFCSDTCFRTAVNRLASRTRHTHTNPRRRRTP